MAREGGLGERDWGVMSAEERDGARRKESYMLQRTSMVRSKTFPGLSRMVVIDTPQCELLWWRDGQGSWTGVG